MLTRLLSYGRSVRLLAMLHILFEWLPVVETFLSAWIILHYFYQTELLVPGIVLLFVLCILQFMYLGFFDRKNAGIWLNQAKLEMKTAYLNSLFSQVDSTTESEVLQRDIKGFERLDSFYQILFPAVIKFVLSFLLFCFLSLLWKSYLPFDVLLYFVLLGLGMRFLRTQGDQTNRRHLTSFMRLGARFLDDLAGMNTLVMYQVDADHQKKFERSSEFFRKKTMALLFYQLQSLFILSFSLFFTLLVALGQSYQQVLTTSFGVEKAVLLWLLFAYLLLSTRQLGYFVHLVKSNTPPLQAIFKIIDQAQLATTQQVTDLQLDKLHFYQVSFGYPGQEKLLTEIDITLKKGKLHGFVGRNGSGKSTLTKLIRGQLKPTSGTIFLGKHNQTFLTQQQIQAHTAYLASEPLLFAGTIEENIRLGMPEKTDWQEVLSAAGLCGFVTALPKAFQTQVGENGKLLSPGQRQQIAFARLLLMDKDIYLFDEATSSIDKQNAQIILNALKCLSQEKLVIVISHKWEEIVQLDDLVFLDQRKVFFGTPESLYQQNQQYQRLADTQLKVEEEQT